MSSNIWGEGIVDWFWDNGGRAIHDRVVNMLTDPNEAPETELVNLMPDEPEDVYDGDEYVGGAAEEAVEAAEPIAVEGGEIEMGVINNVSETIVEMMHDLPELEGMAGAVSLDSAEDLEMLLKKVQDAKWDSEMDAIPVDEEFVARLRAGRAEDQALEAEWDAEMAPEELPDPGPPEPAPRDLDLDAQWEMEMKAPEPTDNFVTRQTVELEEVLPGNQPVSTQLEGTGVTPYELQTYTNVNAEFPPQVELMEFKSIDLPPPAPAESSALLEGPMITPYRGGTLGLDEDYSPFLGEDMEVAMDTVPEIAEVGEAMATAGFDLLPTLEMVGSFAASTTIFGVLGYELVPMIEDMIRGDWLKAPGYDVYKQLQGEVDYIYGSYSDRRNKIRGYFNDNPTYIWFRDNGRAGFESGFGKKNYSFPYGGYSGGDLVFQRGQTGTGLWKRARIITIEGRSIGLLDDMRAGYWVFLRPGNGDVKGKLDLADIPSEYPGFFFRMGYDGALIDDTEQNRFACLLYNLKLLDGALPDKPGTTSAPAAAAASNDDFVQKNNWQNVPIRVGDNVFQNDTFNQGAQDNWYSPGDYVLYFWKGKQRAGQVDGVGPLLTLVEDGKNKKVREVKNDDIFRLLTEEEYSEFIKGSQGTQQSSKQSSLRARLKAALTRLGNRKPAATKQMNHELAKPKLTELGRNPQRVNMGGRERRGHQ